MNRREFMECAAILISGMSASQLGFALSEQQRKHLASAPPYIASEGSYFDEPQRKTIAAMAETILPRTDTPGAIDAGVPRYIELMVADWYNDKERSIFDAGLAAMQENVRAQHGAPFEDLPATTQIEILEAMEDAASDSNYYGLNTDIFAGESAEYPFICQVKELTTWGFFTSEIGCTEVLRHNPMPMRFDGAYPLDHNDSTWSGGIL